MRLSKRPVIWLNVFSWHDGTAMREKIVVSNAPLETPRSGVVVCPVGPYPLSILDGYTGDHPASPAGRGPHDRRSVGSPP